MVEERVVIELKSVSKSAKLIRNNFDISATDGLQARIST